MTGPPLRHIRVFVIVAVVAAMFEGFAARAEDKPAIGAISSNASASDSSSRRHKIAPRSAGDRKGDATSSGSGGWWWSTAGAASILALAGWASLAGRKFLPKTAVTARGMKVIGRTSLSPKHSVYLLRVGSRVLIVGTGPQAPPSLLGELDPRDETASVRPSREPAASFDHRIGDDEA